MTDSLSEIFTMPPRSEPFDRIAYPFPLDERRQCTLWLPRVGLTADEATRLKDYIDSLVIDDD